MTLHILKMKSLYMPNFILVDALIIEILEFGRKIMYSIMIVSMGLIIVNNTRSKRVNENIILRCTFGR